MNAEIEAVEKDRKRIAADLHDEIGPLLTGIKLQLSNMPVDGDAKKNADIIRRHINNMHDSLLTITHDLLPNTLEQNGLFEAVGEFLGEIEMQSSISVTYHVSSLAEASVRSQDKVHIYRIVTELVQNTVKHAEAKRIVLIIDIKKDKLHLFYRDDGNGFNLKKDLYGKRGLGLKNIHSRIELLQGQLMFDAVKNKGVYYEILIPVYEQHQTTNSR
jgi:signal transduction histidine kinase